MSRLIEMISGSHWENGEDQILFQHYPKFGVLGCKSHLARTDPAIAQRARALGLKFSGKPIPKKRSFKIPEHIHPLVRQLLVHVQSRGEPLERVARRAGLGHSALYQFMRCDPRLSNFIAACNAVGLDLKLVEVL